MGPVRGSLQDGNIMHFKINKKTQLMKLMEAYCARQSLQMEQIRFLFDGNRLRDTQTPDELDMEDDDVIDAAAMLFQVVYPLPLSRRAPFAVCSPRPRRASSAPPVALLPRWERRLKPHAARRRARHRPLVYLPS